MRELWPLLLTNALCMACMTSFIAVAGPLVRELGLAEWHGGLIITLAGVCWMLLSRAWGRASDAHGRKPVLLTGIGGFAIAYLLLGAAIDLALTRRPGVLIALTMLALLRGLIGSFYAAIPPASAALIADRTGPERRAQGMAVLGAANGVGIILGPLMGGLLAVYGLDVPMYAAAMLPLLALFVLWRTLPAEAAPGGTDAPAVRLTDPRLRLPLAIMLLVVSCVNVAQLCVGFFVLDRLGLNAAQGARMAGLTMAGVGVALIGVQAVMSRMPGVSLHFWLSGGALLAAAGFAGVTLVWDSWSLVVSYAVCAAGLGVVFPACQALAANSVTATEQGVAAGTLSAAQGVAMVAAPLAGTALYGIFPELPYIMAAAALILMSGIARLRTPRAEAARQAAIRR